MLLPNQIINKTFPSAGRNAYRAADVDEFLQRVYEDYSKLNSENAQLKSKFVSIEERIADYSNGKNHIAAAIIRAETLADQAISDANANAERIISQANETAEQIISRKKREADEYASEVTSQADANYARSKTELDVVLQKAASAAEEYIESVNQKAAEIIAAATERASRIVANAYGDAQNARDTYDSLVAQGKASFDAIKAQAAGFKKGTKELLAVILSALDKVDVFDDEVETPGFSEPTDQPTPAADPVEPFTFDPYAAAEPEFVAEPEIVVEPEIVEETEIVDEGEPVDKPDAFDVSSLLSERRSEIISTLDSFDDISSFGDIDPASWGDASSDEAGTDSDGSDSDFDSFGFGYNGNNTSFSQTGGFGASDFDEE